MPAGGDRGPASKMPRPAPQDPARDKKVAAEYDDRGFDDVERNFQEASEWSAVWGGPAAGWQGLMAPGAGLQVLSSLQQEPGMAPFCAEYSKLVRAVQQAHGGALCNSASAAACGAGLWAHGRLTRRQRAAPGAQVRRAHLADSGGGCQGADGSGHGRGRLQDHLQPKGGGRPRLGRPGVQPAEGACPPACVQAPAAARPLCKELCPRVPLPIWGHVHSCSPRPIRAAL